MAKKKIDKEAERAPSSPGKIVSIFKNETIHFVIGLMLVIFSVYLLLAFSSFFFTGAADQSIFILYPCLSGSGRIEVDAGTHCPLMEMVYRLYIIIGVVLRVFRVRPDGSLSGFFHLSGRYARL